jgi:TfoX/Sxy family transcriptional regulator of competence genes
VAYDEDLAGRIRDLLAEQPDLTEKKMFGGLAFLVRGHMAIVASGRGGALVRVDPDRAVALVARGSAEVAVMRGRPMTGWLRVTDENLRTTRQLDRWVTLALDRVGSLPDKAPATRQR